MNDISKKMMAMPSSRKRSFAKQNIHLRKRAFARAPLTAVALARCKNQGSRP